MSDVEFLFLYSRLIARVRFGDRLSDCLAHFVPIKCQPSSRCLQPRSRCRHRWLFPPNRWFFSRGPSWAVPEQLWTDCSFPGRWAGFRFWCGASPLPWPPLILSRCRIVKPSLRPPWWGRRWIHGFHGLCGAGAGVVGDLTHLCRLVGFGYPGFAAHEVNVQPNNIPSLLNMLCPKFILFVIINGVSLNNKNFFMCGLIILRKIIKRCTD